jgi:hypothetical protein
MRRLLLVVPLLLACDRLRPPPSKVATPEVPAPAPAVAAVTVADTTPVVATPASDSTVIQAGAPMDSAVVAPVDSASAPPVSTAAAPRPEFDVPPRFPAPKPAPENEPLEFDPEGGPALPFVQYGECEAENCARSIVAYACMATTLLAEPDPDAEIVARIPEGEFVQARRDLIVTSAGIVVVKEDFQLDWDESPDDIATRADLVDLAEGDTVYVLRALERGRWTWAYHGRLHDSGAFWTTTMRNGSKRMESDQAVRRSAPTREQWWAVTRLDGSTGWWLQSVTGASPRPERHDELQSVSRMQRERDDCGKVRKRAVKK